MVKRRSGSQTRPVVLIPIVAVRRAEEPTVSGPLSSDTTLDLYDPEEG